MRKEELVAAVAHVRGVLRKSGASSIFRRPIEKVSPDVILSSYAELYRQYSLFSDAEKAVFDALGFAPLLKPETWRPDNSNSTGGVGLAIRYGMYSIVDGYVSSVVNLLKRDTDSNEIIMNEVGESAGATATGEILSFYIREPGAPSLSLRQFSDVITSINELYDIICRVYEFEGSEIILTAMDSGSDFSFDVTGVATGISKLSDLLLQGWDRVRFRKQQVFSASVKAATDGITLLDQIAERVRNETITAEEGEKLKRSVIGNIENVIGNGFYTKEMESSDAAKPSQLPVDRRKMITYQPIAKTVVQSKDEGEDREID